MSRLRDEDPIEWAKVHLANHWSADRASGLLDKKLLEKLLENFHLLTPQVRIRVLFLALHATKHRAIKELSSELESVFKLAQTGDDPDPWVQAIASIFSTLPSERQLAQPASVDSSHVNDCINKLCTSREGATTDDSAGSSAPDLAPLHLRYLSSELVPLTLSSPAKHGHFTLRAGDETVPKFKLPETAKPAAAKPPPPSKPVEIPVKKPITSQPAGASSSAGPSTSAPTRARPTAPTGRTMKRGLAIGGMTRKSENKPKRARMNLVSMEEMQQIESIAQREKQAKIDAKRAAAEAKEMEKVRKKAEKEEAKQRKQAEKQRRQLEREQAREQKKAEAQSRRDAAAAAKARAKAMLTAASNESQAQAATATVTVGQPPQQPQSQPPPPPAAGGTNLPYISGGQQAEQDAAAAAAARATAAQANAQRAQLAHALQTGQASAADALSSLLGGPAVKPQTAPVTGLGAIGSHARPAPAAAPVTAPPTSAPTGQQQQQQPKVDEVLRSLSSPDSLLKPNDLQHIENFLRGVPVTRPDPTKDVKPFLVSKRQVVEDGKRFIELVLFEINYAQHQWRRIRRRKQIG